MSEDANKRIATFLGIDAIKKLDLLANNNNITKKRKGYREVIEQMLGIVGKLCDKYNITLNMESLSEIERLLLGFQSDSQGSRFIFTQNGNGDGKTIKAVPIDMNFALLL